MRDFATLFTGRDDVHGVYTVPAGTKPSQKGKLAGMAATKRARVTAEMYKAHLSGKRRLGIVPIRLDNTTMWVALDADVYKDPKLHPELAKKIARLGLPLCVTRTKSGGAHLWLFFRDAVPAKAARDVGAEIVKRLKLDPKTEIFPKQETIRVEDDGSWINLPYFGKTCAGLDETGTKELSLDAFLEYADDRQVTPADFKIKTKEIAETREQSDDDEDAPPCVVTMLDEGVEEGGRDNALMQLAIYYSRAFPDEWEEKVVEAAKEVMHPALGIDDAAKCIKSIKTKNYQYLCKAQPMCALCDKAACITRKFGVGGGEAATAVVVFDALEKLDGEDPIYRVTMQGRRFQVDGETLMSYAAFRVAAMKALNAILPMMKQPNWESIVSHELAEMDISEAPADTQTAARVVNHFQTWVSQSAQRSKPEMIVETGIPYFDGRSIFFRGEDFLSTIDKMFRISRHEVWAYMRDWGVVEDKMTIKGQVVKLWRYQTGKSDKWFNIEARDRI